MSVTPITTHPSVIEALAKTAPLTPDGRYNDSWNEGKKLVICPVTGHPILRYPPPTEIPLQPQQITCQLQPQEPTGKLKTLWKKIVNLFSF